MKFFLSAIFILSASCAQLDNLVEEPVRCPTEYPLTKHQWDSCADLCSAQPAIVTVEAKTGYLVCECKGGTKFRVTKMAQSRAFERI